MKVSLGIVTYRDREKLRELLRSISSQRLRKVRISEILIVAPEDDQAAIQKALKTQKVTLVNEGRRKGKYAAVNLFLKKAKSDVLILCSGDVTLEENAIERLCVPLEDLKVGIVASHPVPLGGGRNKRMEQTIGLLWELRHTISLSSPKFGEVIAFRNLHLQIPKSAVDEEMLVSIILSRGYRAAYACDAVVYNQGAKTAADYIRQRRRIYCGHLALKKEQGYTAPTLSNLKVLRCLLSDKSLRKPPLPGLAYAALLEGLSRFLGTVDFLRGTDHSRWKIIHKGVNKGT